MNDRRIVVHPDAGVLVGAVAARLTVRLLDAQAARGTASVVLTGGGIAVRVYEALRDGPVRDAVDWSRVDVWWGDERFLPAGHPDRNETQARRALLDGLPLDPARVHPMPASDGPDGDDPDAAADRYARELAGAAVPGGSAQATPLPHFDVLLLGIGEDGHVASVFPGHPAVREQRPVVAVRDSPKPPPTRLTLTYPVINSADEVWLVASGEAKAHPVRNALAGAPTVQVPAAGVRGVASTLWLLDQASA